MARREFRKSVYKRDDMNITHRKARLEDLKEIVSLLADDQLGNLRERSNSELIQDYIDAFARINSDSNQYLMVLECNEEIIGTCHASLIASLTFLGSTRLQIEAVRVNSNVRKQNFGQQMIQFAIDWGKERGAKIVQLTTNNKRLDAIRFYEKLGFAATHTGMKLYL